MEDRAQRAPETVLVSHTKLYKRNPDYHPYIQPEFSHEPPTCAVCNRSAVDPVHNPFLDVPDHTKGAL